MAISVSEAVLKTAAVEIKTLCLSNKQMTLAVFRQLPSEPAIDPDSAALSGTPWGRVNYCSGSCHTSPHIHVVWQRGNQLLRSTVRNDPRNQPGYESLYERQTAALEGMILSLLLAGQEFKNTKFSRYNATFYAYGRERSVPVPHETSYLYDHLRKDAAELAAADAAEIESWHALGGIANEFGYGRTAEKIKEDRDARVQGYRTAICSRVDARAKELAINDGTPEIFRAISRECESQMKEFVRLWNENYQHLNALDQLFIAV